MHLSVYTVSREEKMAIFSFKCDSHMNKGGEWVLCLIIIGVVVENKLSLTSSSQYVPVSRRFCFCSFFSNHSVLLACVYFLDAWMRLSSTHPGLPVHAIVPAQEAGVSRFEIEAGN